ncbi:MAG: NAD(P)/FAD-dependent oxidoreductase, partial [Candidatus Subteraquimicrobiales bacterium]|nr:NAD(P)/FAD-dependent oxidoreductase [Candidatus Subteraquimicrobiales bacterium]
MEYEVIIAGASFAGLSVARELKDKKIFLIDRRSIGAFTASACAAPLSLLEENGCEQSVLKVTDKIRFTTPYGSITYNSIIPVATFDYELFCKEFAPPVEFKKANIINFDGKTLSTTNGSYTAKIFVDCTGWRAKLARSLNPKAFTSKKYGFGIETEVDFQSDELHFIYDPKIIKGGYAWTFPAGKKSRFGVGSYTAKPNLRVSLEKLLALYGLKTNKVYGGFMPAGIRRAILGELFLVGDAAAQILPLTGEGIRQSLYFGKKAGKLIHQVLNQE